MRLAISPIIVTSAIAASFWISSGRAISCPLDLSPPNNFYNGVNERGFVSYWEQIDSIDLGGLEGLKIPLTINFRSDRNGTSDYLPGFQLFPLQSSVYQINERNFVQVEPSGATRYFYRANPQDTVLKDRGGWAAEINESNETVTIWPECGGSKMVYTRGRISSLAIGSRKLDFIYLGNRVSEIRENGDTVLKLDTEGATGMLRALEFNGKRITVSHSTRPLVESVNGQNLVSATTPALAKLDGTARGNLEYRFAVNDKLQPTLSISGPARREFTWDPVSKHILVDTGITYAIKPGTDGILPNASITRRHPDGGIELWHHDRRKGFEISQSLDGVQTITHYFATGALAGKVRRIEKVEDGKTIIVREVAYDEEGAMIRQTDAAGVQTNFKRDEHGRAIEVSRAGRPLAKRDFDAQGRITQFEVFGGVKTTFQYLSDGGREETVVDQQGHSTTQIYDKLDNRREQLSAQKGRGMSVAAEESVPSATLRSPEDRALLVDKKLSELDLLKEPVNRADLLIRIGRLYTDRTFGPSDPASAIKMFQRILDDDKMDAYSKGQACSWIASSCIELGKSHRAYAIKQVETLLNLKGDGLSQRRQNGLWKEQKEGFRMLLALNRTGQPETDLKIWEEILSRFGSKPEFKDQLEYMLTEQKNQLAVRAFSDQ